MDQINPNEPNIPAENSQSSSEQSEKEKKEISPGGILEQEKVAEVPKAPEVSDEQPSSVSPIQPPVQAPSQPPAQTPQIPPKEPTEDSGLTAEKDEPIIGKEWVDRAKEIIKEDKKDPYKEEEDVESLQIKYQKKRFGREVKKSQD